MTGPNRHLPAKPYRPRGGAERLAMLAGMLRLGKTYQEIADAMGGTANGVRSNVRRLRAKGVL